MSCIFCQIVAGKIPARVVVDAPDVLAFRDLHPVAPTHVLVIPKRHIDSLAELTEADAALIGRLFVVARQVAEMEGARDQGFRAVINTGPDANQTVFHVHLHVLAGRQMSWPPG
jgi:histidine triad (HIT) family protein